jgi:Domain of unknown function (DUF397)
MHSVNPGDVAWRKSSYSAANGDCVEIARLADGYIGVRDSKNISMSALGLTPAQWRTFVGEVKHGRLDRS